MALTSASIKTEAAECGFDLCGIASAERHPRLLQLADWIARGYSGDMTYLADSLDERLDPARVLPTARSIVSLGTLYNTNQPYSTSLTDVNRTAIARYAWGEDYHGVLRERLRRLVRWMAEGGPPGLEAFSCVDSGPMQERVFAEQAGLGWIGKNTCVINPRLGSWIFLAEIVTNVDLEIDTPAVDQCGTCQRCLEACPTGALVEPYVLDATRCLSYLTIETRESVDAALRPAIGPRVFGCDVCQDVCPWNRRAVTSDDPAWMPREALAFPRLLELCEMSDEAWRALLKGSALRRAGLRRIRRSLAYATVHLEDEARAQALRALARHETAGAPAVAEAIEWARGGQRPKSEVEGKGEVL